MTFNRPVPPVELFIRKLGWAVASSWTHSSASCREHQGLGDLALIVSLASLHWCLSHKGREPHFQKPFFDHYLSFLLCLKRERERFEVISVNIHHFFSASLNTSLLPSLENHYLIFLFIFVLPQHLGGPVTVCTVVRVGKWGTAARLW